MRASQPEPLPSLGMRVLELWRYPIKSIGGDAARRCRGRRVRHRRRPWLGPGRRGDGNVLTARRAPTLLMATCAIVDGVPVTTTVEGDVLRTSADYSDWLGQPVRLEHAGDTGGTYENPMDFENDADWISWQGPAGAWHDSGRSVSRSSAPPPSRLGRSTVPFQRARRQRRRGRPDRHAPRSAPQRSTSPKASTGVMVTVLSPASTATCPY